MNRSEILQATFDTIHPVLLDREATLLVEMLHHYGEAYEVDTSYFPGLGENLDVGAPVWASSFRTYLKDPSLGAPEPFE